MRRLALLLLAAAFLPRGLAAETPAPTFCAEWIRQSREGYERLTLFADRMLVWKSNRGGAEQLKKQRLPPEELTYYCDFFARPESWALPRDLRSGLTGDFVRQSAVTLTRPDGSRKEIRFDELSALSPEASALRSALEGLKGILFAPLAPASRFTPKTLLPGTILKRFDGAFFRVEQVIEEKGVVELEGVNEPYIEYRRIEDLRYLFSPPE